MKKSLLLLAGAMLCVSFAAVANLIDIEKSLPIRHDPQPYICFDNCKKEGKADAECMNRCPKYRPVTVA